MKKIGLLCLALVLALGTMGVGYAMWFEDLYIDGIVNTGELDWQFLCGSVICGDPGTTIDKQCGDNFENPYPESTGKHVGTTEVVCLDTDQDGDVDTLQVTVTNGYPHYYVHVAWRACNNGTIPLHFERAIIGSGAVEYPFYDVPASATLDGDGDGIMDIEVWFGNNFGAQVHPGDCIDQSFDLHLLQQPVMLQSYTFFIKLTAVQYNETLVPPP